MDILGIIGGIYEILYILTSLFLTRVIEWLVRRNLVKKIHHEDQQQWFTYPSRTKEKRGNKVIQGDFKSSDISDEEGRILNVDNIKRQISD